MANPITNIYTANEKTNGQVLSAEDWNGLASAVETAHSTINSIISEGVSSNTPASNNVTVTDVTEQGGDATANVAVVSGIQDLGSPNIIQLTKKKKGVNTTLVSGNNINVEPRESVGETKGGNISFKPGDDIEFCSHHRLAANQDEVSVKIIDGDDNPVKLQLNAAEMTLTTKDKTGSDANVFDINVNSGKNTKGYLKVRAQAIDLRCEENGGIALQPKGEDGQHHMNKIKFEHGGGDGLEFGTFNTEKTSIYTDEYRFKRDGVWKMATRTKSVSDKYDDADETTHYKYTKQADDFYDVISPSDEQCTTKDIIKTAFALNGAKDRHAKITNKGAIEIATNATYSVVIEETPIDVSGVININTIAEVVSEFASVAEGLIFNDGDFQDGHLPVASTVYTNGTQYFSFTEIAAPAIKIDSGGELKLGGILDFGSTFNFGETDGGIEVQYKLTKKNATKDCGVLKVVGYNNSTSQDLTVEGVTIPAKSNSEDDANTATIAQCSILDIIKLVNFFKNGAGLSLGPWA